MIISTINFGFIGTALSVVLTYVPFFFISFLLLRKYIQYNIVKESLIRIFGAIVMILPMILIINLLNAHPLLVLGLNLIIAVVIYTLVVNCLTKGNFLKEMREIFNTVLRRDSQAPL
jgi:O-antigen/teichoic acid export membrane protein